MSLIDAVNESWGWCGIAFARVRAQSPMGHLILSDLNEGFYYLDPDGMAITPLGSREDAEVHLNTYETKELWFGGELYDEAIKLLGEPKEGYVLNLELDAMIESRICADNTWTWPLEELIRRTGEVANQLQDLPEGAKIVIEVTD